MGSISKYKINFVLKNTKINKNGKFIAFVGLAVRNKLHTQTTPMRPCRAERRAPFFTEEWTDNNKFFYAF